MTTYTIKSKTLNPNKVFILQKSELEKRLDPFFYIPELLALDKKIKSKNHYKLGEICEPFKNGSTPKDGNFASSGVLYYRSQDFDLFELKETQYITENFNDKIKRSEVKINDIMLAVVGATLGKVGFISSQDKEGNINQNIARIRLNSKIYIPKFLALFLSTEIGQKQIKRNATITTQAYLNNEVLGNILIPFVSLENQKIIISIFDGLFAQKQQNEAQAHKLLSGIDDYLLRELGIQLPNPPENTLKHRMFTSTFKEISGGRFDPNYHQVYFHKLILSIVNSKYKCKKLGEEINEINYGASFVNDYVNSGVPLLRIKDLRQNEIIIEKVVFLPETARKLLGNSFVKQNDFLITRSGTIGVVAVVPKDIDGFAFGSFMIKFNLKSDKILNREFLSYYLNCKLLINLLQRDKIGAVQGNITIPTIKSLLIPIPPLDKQKEIADHITGIRQQAQLLKDKTNEALKKASAEIEQILLNE